MGFMGLKGQGEFSPPPVPQQVALPTGPVESQHTTPVAMHAPVVVVVVVEVVVVEVVVVEVVVVEVVVVDVVVVEVVVVVVVVVPQVPLTQPRDASQMPAKLEAAVIPQTEPELSPYGIQYLSPVGLSSWAMQKERRPVLKSSQQEPPLT